MILSKQNYQCCPAFAPAPQIRMKLDDVITVLLASIIAVGGYEVTIMITPPTGPYLTDRTIGLSCFVNPTPPDPVIYRWRILRVYGSWESSGQNISYTPSYRRDFHHLWLHCQVLSNAVQVTEGKKVIEVYGFVFPLEHPVRSFTPGDTLSLQVNISTIYSQARHIQSLAWYHNGSQICNCRTRNNGTVLVIPNAKSSDAGTYQVKISVLDFGRPDCDARILPEIEFLAMGAPVTFILTQDHISGHEFQFLPRKRYFVINSTNTNVVELSNEYCFHLNTTQILAQNHYERWYQNGLYININNAKYNSTVLTKQNGELIFTIEISNVSGDDLGDYVGTISGNIFDLTRWCNEYRYSFFTYYYYFRRYYLPSAISYSSIEVYRPPLVTILSSMMAALLDETVHIKCSAEDGNPDLHNITLLKNNTLLMVSIQTNSLTYDTKGAFGVYTCLVESLYTTATKSLVLQEKANFQLFLGTNTHGQCTLFLNDSSAITSNANEIIQHLCNCSATVQLTSLYCTSEQSLMLKGTVAYSDPDGNITATAVVDILQEWILTSDSAAITIDGSVLELSKSCPTRTNSLINNTCQAFPVDSSSIRQTVGYISGSFIGGVITGSLISVLTMLVCFRFKTRMNVAGSTPVTRNKEEEEEEVLMGTNEAYETVALHRYQPPATVLHQRNVQEEPVYELAFTS